MNGETPTLEDRVNGQITIDQSQQLEDGFTVDMPTVNQSVIQHVWDPAENLEEITIIQDGNMIEVYAWTDITDPAAWTDCLVCNALAGVCEWLRRKSVPDIVLHRYPIRPLHPQPDWLVPDLRVVTF